jgi:hypothetical protein
VKNWQIILISILITLTIGGGYLFSVWRHRQDPGVIGQQIASQRPDLDKVSVIRSIFPSHFEDTLQLEGSTVWMKNGYLMPYYPYTSGHVVFAKRVGVIPAAQKLQVKKIVKQAAPANEDDGMSHGSRQAFAVFTLPGDTTLYATPIGAIGGSEEAYFCDMLFYYDDPHTIFDRWPKEVWTAVDAHQVKPGMSELETRMAIGRKTHTSGGKEGDRTVTFDQDGKHWTITYVNNRATEIKVQ